MVFLCLTLLFGCTPNQPNNNVLNSSETTVFPDQNPSDDNADNNGGNQEGNEDVVLPNPDQPGDNTGDEDNNKNEDNTAE